MLTFIDVEYGANGALRLYQHPTLGVIEVVTMWGRDGSADVVNLHSAIKVARGLLEFATWERNQETLERRRAPRKRSQRARQGRIELGPSLPRPPRGPDTKPAA